MGLSMVAPAGKRPTTLVCAPRQLTVLAWARYAASDDPFLQYVVVPVLNTFFYPSSCRMENLLTPLHVGRLGMAGSMTQEGNALFIVSLMLVWCYLFFKLKILIKNSFLYFRGVPCSRKEIYLNPQALELHLWPS